MALPPAIRRPLEEAGLLAPIAPPEPADRLPTQPTNDADNVSPEIGRMVSRDGDSGWLPDAYMKLLATNPDTILAKDGGGLKLYDALLDDDVAFSALQQRRMAITSRDWEVAPGDDKDPRSVKAADEFRAMLKALGYDRVTGLLHYFVWYGYAVAEAIYEIRDYDGRPIVWLKDVVVPDRRWFGFTTEGELRFVNPLVRFGRGVEDETLPPNKFLVIRTGGTHDFAFYGLGLAHWAYWPIFFKRSALKFWALYLEKFGMPTVAIGFPESEKDDNEKLSKRLAAAVAVGQDRAVLVPEQTLKDDTLKLIEAERTGAGSSSYSDFVGMNDDALIRVILGQTGTSKATPGGLGGDGQAKKDEGVKREIVKADSDAISDAMHRLAGWLTTWNHGADVAPPTCYRVLDDEEDLNTVAERDVKLNGIGIKRTEDSVADVYGDGYEVDRLSEEDKAANATALASAKVAAGLPGQGAIKPANDNKAKIRAAAAEFGVDDTAPLYISRKLLNSGDLIAWAKANGIETTVPADEMHVTVLYSKTAVDWFGLPEDWMSDSEGRITIKGGPRLLKRFDGGAVVLRFGSSDLEYRHRRLIEEGASSDYPEYKPHVTLSYDVPADLDLDAIPAFDGELRFGPETFEKIEPSPTDPSSLAFTADEEAAIDRLITALVDEANPVFSAMGDALRTSLQGVKTLEGARVAILEAVERMPVERLAQITALPMLAARAGALAGAEDEIRV